MKYLNRKEKRKVLAASKRLNLTPTRVHVRTYLNDAVTVENIKKAKAFLRDAKVDDVFILFIAGHGVHDTDRGRTYYYLTHDTNLKNLSKTAANFELIEDLLHNIAPRRKLFLMDTCESGVIDDDLEKRYLTKAGSRGMKARTMRAISVKLKKNNPSHRINRFFPADRNRFIYNDLSRRSGAIVFSSSRGNEFSYESEKIENGFFTEAIIRALTDKSADRDGDGWVTVDELRDFVSGVVAENTGGSQHPVVDRDNIYQKFGFPLLK